MRRKNVLDVVKRLRLPKPRYIIKIVNDTTTHPKISKSSANLVIEAVILIEKR